MSGAETRAKLRMERAAYKYRGGRWAWKTKPPSCEYCGDWGTVSNPENDLLPRVPCICKRKSP